MSHFRFIFSFLLWFSLLPGCHDPENKPENKPVSFCGDGRVDWERGEWCDGEAMGGDTCLSLGFYNASGTLSCMNDCWYDVSDCGGTCGDGVASPEHGEECDIEDFTGATCESLDRGSGVLRCSYSCKLQLDLCEGRCGNGMREESEECDDGNVEAGDGCGPDCAVEEGWYCGYTYQPNTCWTDCGDGLAIEEEECDGDDLRGQTCESLGFSGGTLDCTFFTCEYMTRDCIQ
jgi:cysteine-rich repeat protein